MCVGLNIGSCKHELAKKHAIQCCISQQFIYYIQGRPLIQTFSYLLTNQTQQRW